MAISSRPIRWGILATGNIARKFALGLQELPDAVIHAVGSRTTSSADQFAEEFEIPNKHYSYESLAADPEVDVIYIATPHPFHLQNALLCMNGGKAVLCEKPLTVNAAESQQLISAAKKNDVFLMEAMWTRFLPIMVYLQQALEDGVIGDVKMLTAHFCFRSNTWDMTNRKFNPDLGGGALLDIGIYPLAFAYMIFKEDPIQVESTAYLGETMVDEQSAYLFKYANGAIAQMSSSFHITGPREALICGTKGVIRMPQFWRGSQVILEIPDEEDQVMEFPFVSSGLQFEAQHVMDCLREGKKESDVMPLSETLRIMEMMDRFREEWGVKYPWE